MKAPALTVIRAKAYTGLDINDPPPPPILDRLLRACATGRGCRALAPSADALDLLVEIRVFLGEQIERRVLFVWHVAGLRHVAGPGLTMADRSLRDGAIDGRDN